MATKHTPTVIKFSSSLALLLTVAGILLAIGGQLDFLGNERAQPATPVAQKHTTASSQQQPKYSFYDELKKRKSELDSQRQQTITSNTNKPSTPQQTEQYSYVVQVGAFSYKKDANTVKNKLEALGLPNRIVKGSRKYLVQAGPFQGKQRASDAEKQLRSKKLDTLIKHLK